MLSDWAHSILLSLLTACGANVERNAATQTAEVFGFSPNRCVLPFVGFRPDGGARKSPEGYSPQKRMR